MKFTYLDLIDPTILFAPIMATNWFKHEERFYSLFTDDENKKFQIPGYRGKRCIIEFEMAQQLSKIQEKLVDQGFSLKVYDAYRPQKTVDFFTEWTQLPDTPLVKKVHYPCAEKKNFHTLSYLSQTSSHTLGTAVDLTIIHTHSDLNKDKEKDLLGLWDPQSLDMGNVGYLAFDERSWHTFGDLTIEQKENRNLLKNIMVDSGFDPLETEFWHYYFSPQRNRDTFFNFEIRDNYRVLPDLTLDLDQKT